MTVLTKENAKNAKIIRNIQHPEWGNKPFQYNGQPLNDGRFASTWGTGSSSAVLFEGEYHFWEVIA